MAPPGNGSQSSRVAHRSFPRLILRILPRHHPWEGARYQLSNPVSQRQGRQAGEKVHHHEAANRTAVNRTGKAANRKEANRTDKAVNRKEANRSRTATNRTGKAANRSRTAVNHSRKLRASMEGLLHCGCCVSYPRASGRGKAQPQ